MRSCDGYADIYSNVHRGAHFLSGEATVAFEQARETCRAFVNAAKADEIIFTKGGTEAINLVASSLAADICEGDEIIVSEMEHHSNIVPWNFLRERKGAVLKWAPIRDDGAFDLEAFAALLNGRTENRGDHPDVQRPGHADAGRRDHKTGAWRRRQGADRRLSGLLSTRSWTCRPSMRFLRLHRPQALRPHRHRLLYGKYDLLSEMQPYQGGGEMIADVYKDKVTYAAPPHRFEAGTPPIVEAIGLGAALDFMMGLDREAVAAHEAALLTHATEEIDRIGKIAHFWPCAAKRAPW